MGVSMGISAENELAGQSVYTPKALRLYDVAVLGVSNRFIWRCPTSCLLDHFNSHTTRNHLDVGVGTGFFLDRCRFPSPSPRIVLLDLNANALEYAARRIARYRPTIHQQSVFRPLQLEGTRFDSVSVNYLLHCLPGTISEKAVVFDHLIDWMNPRAVVFGSTLLSTGVRTRWMAKRLMRFYNRKRIFCNESDSLVDLESMLRSRFDDVEVRVIGNAALFSGRRRA